MCGVRGNKHKCNIMCWSSPYNMRLIIPGRSNQAKSLTTPLFRVLKEQSLLILYTAPDCLLPHVCCSLTIPSWRPVSAASGDVKQNVTIDVTLQNKGWKFNNFIVYSKLNAKRYKFDMNISLKYKHKIIIKGLKRKYIK